MAASGRLLTDVEFSVIPDLSMTAAPRSGAAFSLDVIPDLGMVLPGPIPAEFDMAVIPDLGVEAEERYTRDFTIDAPADMGMVASERYTRSFELAVIPDIGADATMRRSGAFTLDAVPDIGMTGTGVMPPAEVTYNATGTGNARSGNGALTWTHNATGDGRAVVVAVSVVGVNPTASAPTYGGQPMTQLGVIGHNNTTNGRTYLFGLLNPPTGNQTVSVNVSATLLAAGSGNSVSYNGVASFGAVATSFGSNASPALTASSAPNRMVAQAFGFGAASLTSYNRTQRYSNISTTGRIVVGDTPGAASVTFNATLGGSIAWSGIAVNLHP